MYKVKETYIQGKRDLDVSFQAREIQGNGVRRGEVAFEPSFVLALACEKETC